MKLNYKKNDFKYEFSNIKIYTIILLFLVIYAFYNINILQTKVPEINDFNNQTLNLFIPSKESYKFCQRTLFFTSEFKNKNIKNNFKISKIKLNKKYKNYFVTYLIDNDNYYYINLLNENGLLKNNFSFGYQNLIISDFIQNSFKKYSLNKYQKVFHNINGNSLFQKDILYKNYLNMKEYFNNDFNYMTETYYYPEQKDFIENKFSNYKINKNNLWLIKPKNKWAGKGIFIFKSLKKIKKKQYIITKYKTNLNLIKNKKYDLRLYVLVTGLRPLRIYFYKEGLVRIASEKYSLNINSFKNIFIHLTNTDINKISKNYVYPNNTDDENANIWNLKTYKKYLKKNYNMDFNNINIKIKDIIIKTIISVQDKLIQNNIDLNLSDNNFYNLLGFDILITDKFEPILLEVNNPPSLDIYDKVDLPMKTNIFIDTLNIVGIIPFSRKSFKSLDKQYIYKNNINQLVNNALCETYRPKGDYELIFPVKENIFKYKKYFIHNNKENEKFWDKIIKK